ncbi:hypothetical protein [Nocardia ninae]|uniref:hypothetical protein n=1 Tax=Nocardia ninae TaxID=356145 RepID=UPI0011BE41B3|nr:hypothetical protein [Nocardia ninae]
MSPDRPIAVSLPPVEATGGQPLPDAGPFLRVCAGVAEPSTALLRCVRELVGMWRYAYQQQPQDKTELDKLLNLAVYMLDHEASGHTKMIVPEPDSLISPSSYGDWAAWLVWKYVLYALRRQDPAHADRDAAELLWCIEAFNHLVADVRAGRVRLPEAAGVFPPKPVSPDSPGSDTATTRPAASDNNPSHRSPADRESQHR